MRPAVATALPALLDGAAPPDSPAPAPRSDESAFIERLRLHDPAAYEELVRAHGGRMLAVARRLLRNDEDARDAVQQAFFSAFAALSEFNGRCRLSTWLHRIVVNAALMKLRSRSRRPEETSIDALLPQFAESGHHAQPVSDWAAAVDTQLVRRETCERVRRAIDRLPEAYRTVLLLRDIEELDTEETARVLRTTPNAVKIRLHRARQALARVLEPEFRPRRA
jgi:RNA polymerase sigma-70 factor, ECF subfamily